MEAKFRKRIQNVQQLAFGEKIKVKERMNRKMLENLQACKAHGGPITEKDMCKLDSLTYDQLVIEVGYLKKTIAPQLQFKRKVEKKMVNFTGEQLRTHKDVIKPVNNSSNDLNSLLETALNDDTTAIVKSSGGIVWCSWAMAWSFGRSSFWCIVGLQHFPEV
jgi:hypothetical protein